MTNPEDLLSRASMLLAAGRTGAARPFLAAARGLLKEDRRLAELGAMLDIREGNYLSARESLDDGIATWPEALGLRKLRAEVRLRLDDLPGALTDAADCVIQAADDPSAKALLGTVLLEAGQANDAEICLRDAVRDVPGNAGYVRALAAAQDALGDPAAAATTLAAGIASVAGDIALRNSAVLLAVRQRDFGQAVALAQSACAAGVADACLFGLLGHALSSLGRHEDAASAYREAFKLGPDDPYVRHLVAASGVVASAERAPDDYVRTVFDGYADRFEQHLIDLGYRVPGLVRAALLRHRPEFAMGAIADAVLDLGCGTGLIAVALSDLALGPLVGVDLSSRMLASAARKDIYTELHEAEIGVFLDSEQRLFSAVIAADVLCYFGALDSILSGIARRLEPGGLLIFSVEVMARDLPGDAWALGRQGRYCHRESYVRASLARADLTILDCSSQSLRQEAGAPVPGLLVVAERTA